MFAFVSKLSARVVRTLSALLLMPDSEPSDRPFPDSDVAQFHRLRSDPARHSVDDATWRDLLLGDWLRTLAREVSIFGQHVLYQRLRSGGSAGQPARLRALMDDPDGLARAHLACKPLRHAETEIATLLYQDAAPLMPRWVDWTWVLPIALVLSILAVALSPLAWLAAGVVLYLLMSTQMRYYERVGEWERKLASLSMLLRVDSLLHGDGRGGQINRAISRSPLVQFTPGLQGYQDWFMLENVNHYFKSARLVHANLDFLRDCFERIGNLEADLALARHLLATPQFCWSQPGARDQVAMAGMRHPLLAEALPLDLHLAGKGAFISGQNGVGKSTLLRTAGLNLVAARAFGFCYAASARVPDLPVYVSIHSEDSLFGGESLYMAELRRAQELLAATSGPHPGICIIDEIFRGTNHMESVSAAASVLDVLAAQGLVIVSSHNLVLGALLAHRLDPLCVARGADGVLALAPGVLAHTNGIALLAQRGFGTAIEANAGKVFDWLSGYLAHPADSASVLGERASGTTARSGRTSVSA